MTALIIHPEQHPRFGSNWSIPTEVAVNLDDEDGDGSGYFVVLSVETEWGETLNGPPSAHQPDTSLHARGDDLHRNLDPDEARALAAALWHFADVADRRRAR